MMRFYNQQHQFYCGVDLHAKTLHLCVLDQAGEILRHRGIRARRQDFLRTIHGSKTKNDKIDSQKIARLLRGGNFPMSYVYPRQMRSTRDLLRRRCFLVRRRGDTSADIHNDVLPQCNLRFAKQTVSVVPVHLLNIRMMNAMIDDEICFPVSCAYVLGSPTDHFRPVGRATVILGSKVLGEGNCASGDRPWEGSLRIRSSSRHPLRRRPHSYQSCEATNRNLIQGRIGQESATLHWRSAGPNHEEQGGATDELGSRCRAVDVRLPQWRYPRTKVRHLVQLGVDLQMAIKHAISRKRYWRMSRTPAMRYAMPNKWLEQQGLLSLNHLWGQLALLRGTA